MLKIENLKAKREDKEILKGIDLKVNAGEIHAIMGPNGSGKSTLASSLMGHPDIDVEGGSAVTLDDQNVLEMDVNERALAGLFLAFQYPVEIQGVSYPEFLRLSYNNIRKYRDKNFKPLSQFRFKKLLQTKMEDLKMHESFLDRNLNEGFSGGEKKKSEILQMAILEPKYAILDETDSGLDVTALKIVGEGSQKLSTQNNIGIIVITHYKRILEYLKPNYVHILVDGKIVKSGDSSLADELDKDGYEKYTK